MEKSKELEIAYMEKFIGQPITFIPEVYRDGYVIGHTGNYLLVKCLGSKDLLHQSVERTLMKVEYPYVIAN